MAPGRIRSGVGGWTFEPWRGLFYPEGLTHAKELSYAASRFTSLEINSTYYSRQSPASFAKWAAATPDDFVFAVKASRYCTNRKILADAGEAVERFMEQGLGELGDKLGPILWQFMPTKKFQPDDFEGFLKLLPRSLGSRPLRHALEVRHQSFSDPKFVDLAARYGAAVVTADSPERPMLFDLTADFVYVRLQNAHSDLVTGYPTAELAEWAERAQAWASGSEPLGLPRLRPGLGPSGPKDVFVFLINGAKERAPAAAAAFLAAL
jgi:uncharacterized protein YecE (DUF72 family)